MREVIENIKLCNLNKYAKSDHDYVDYRLCPDYDSAPHLLQFTRETLQRNVSFLFHVFYFPFLLSFHSELIQFKKKNRIDNDYFICLH